ncbi:MAG: DUF427 domain-containing protein [Nocardioidaceae bacterium]
MARATWHSATIAESDDVVEVEGNLYFPRDSVDDTMVEPTETTSVCPWKGTATYLTVVVDGERNPDAAWTYQAPKQAAEQITGRVAFWRGVTVER